MPELFAQTITRKKMLSPYFKFKCNCGWWVNKGLSYLHLSYKTQPPFHFIRYLLSTWSRRKDPNDLVSSALRTQVLTLSGTG